MKDGIYSSNTQGGDSMNGLARGNGNSGNLNRQLDNH